MMYNLIKGQMYDCELIRKKNEIIDSTIEVLKREFIGIDSQIEELLNNLRAWFLFPELRTKPLVINLWGMTGVGKTSLIKRTAELLGIEGDTVYFNFSEVSAMTVYDIEEKLECDIDISVSNKLFIYDEFQYAATLDGGGNEKDNRGVLRVFWELIDTGSFERRFSPRDIHDVRCVLNFLYSMNEIHHPHLANGVWLNEEECIQSLKDTNIYKQYSPQINFDYDIFSKIFPEEEFPEQYIERGLYVGETSVYVGSDRYFIKPQVLNKILFMYFSLNGYRHNGKVLENIYSMDYEMLVNFLEELLKKARGGYKVDYSNSVIVVLGNLDEAYTGGGDFNPDISADQFNAVTKRISLVDVKEALRARFRNEQIARLGNIHILYPSFSSGSFRKIIDLYLMRFADKVKKIIGLDVAYDESVKKIIFKEAVFPTQGVRPILSTIFEMIEGKLPLILTKLSIEGITNASTIKYSFSRSIMRVIVYNESEEELTKYTFKENLRLNKLRANRCDERQASVAVHESGHFVMYVREYGKLPDTIRSVASSSDIEGFTLGENQEREEVRSARLVRSDIRVLLGGHIAEQIVFGKDFSTNGASQDLRRATIIASRYVREWGMCGMAHVSTYNKNDALYSDEYSLVCDDQQEYYNTKIKDLINECCEEVYQTLSNGGWKRMFGKASKYLMVHSSMGRSMMRKCYNEVSVEERTVINGRYYRDMVANMEG